MGGLGIERRMAMQEYEFVPKREYQPVRKEIEQIIHKAQRLLKQPGFVNEKMTFQYMLIGSGKRHLITRIKGGNKGFDFDYNLILQSEPGYYRIYAKEALFKAFQEAIKGTYFQKIENSTSAITIKSINKNKSKVNFSCDFGIVYYNGNREMNYLHTKKRGGPIICEWRKRQSAIGMDRKLKELKECWPNHYWEYIKSEYLDLKNKNSAQKRSFHLYMESVNNVHNWMMQEKKKKNAECSYESRMISFWK